MNEKIIRVILKFLEVKQETDEYLRISYLLLSVLNELEKILTVVIIYSLFHKEKEVAVIILIMSMLRTSMGGSHMNTNIKCLIMTILMCSFPILAASKNLSAIFFALAVIVDIACIVFLAPVYSHNRIKYSGNKLIAIRVKGLIKLALIVVLYSACENRYWKSIIGYTIIVITMDFFVAGYHNGFTKKQQGECKDEEGIGEIAG